MINFELINSLKSNFFKKKTDKIYYIKVSKNEIYLVYKPSLIDLESLVRQAQVLITCHGAISHIANSFKKFINYVNFVESDSLLFLKNFKHKIDFLYLDSLDGHNPSDASMHQLNEAKSAIDKLHRNSLILLDDKNLKTTQSLEFLLANKFNILNETDEQILLGY